MAGSVTKPKTRPEIIVELPTSFLPEAPRVELADLVAELRNWIDPALELRIERFPGDPPEHNELELTVMTPYRMPKVLCAGDLTISLEVEGDLCLYEWLVTYTVTPHCIHLLFDPI